ncbi:unnamed protein product [Arctia plantaginis]|uniref:Regulator of microtubule dynamics protein 1 n=1 Tax=Arctia plantaginis TaxID=874455 RepID=A0A8S1A427_ARCPL|nr:unnamed protein product [Arctia plantaginis]
MVLSPLRLLNPVTYKFVSTIFYSAKIIGKSNPKRLWNQYSYFLRRIVGVSATFAFFWPVKKKKHVIERTATGQPIVVLDVADNLFESGHYEQCYDLLKEYELENSVEIQWRICRVLYNMSKEQKYDRQYKKTLLLEAYEIISEQLEKNPDHYAVHKWYALLVDAKSSQDGIKERIRQLETVKKHMDMAVTLNPNDATILYMLGEWCFQIAELPWHQRKIANVLFASPPHSTYEDALDYFLKAESVKPRFYSFNLLRIGICYFKLKKEDQAKYYLRLAASYPAKTNDDHTANTTAAEYLKKLKAY